MACSWQRMVRGNGPVAAVARKTPNSPVKPLAPDLPDSACHQILHPFGFPPSVSPFWVMLARCWGWVSGGGCRSPSPQGCPGWMGAEDGERGCSKQGGLLLSEPPQNLRRLLRGEETKARPPASAWEIWLKIFGALSTSGGAEGDGAVPEVVGKSQHLPQQSLGGVVTRPLGVPGQGSSSLSLAATDGVPIGAVAPSQPAGPPCPESTAGRRFCCSPCKQPWAPPACPSVGHLPGLAIDLLCLCCAWSQRLHRCDSECLFLSHDCRSLASSMLHGWPAWGCSFAGCGRAPPGCLFFFPFTPAEDGACLASASTLKDARFKVFFCGWMDRMMLSDALSVLGDFSNGDSGCWFGASPPDVGRRYCATSLGCHP